MTIEHTVEKFMNASGNVALAGDWHGKTIGATMSIEKIVEQSDAEVILHLGDYGVWGEASGRKYLFSVNKLLKKFDKVLFVTLGNHENYNLIEKFENVPGMPGCLYEPGNEHVVYFSRGFKWTWNDKKFMSFGGANSIDRRFRTVDKDWWAQEQISDADVAEGIKVGSVDVMLSHDAPYGSDILGSHRSVNLGLDIEMYANESRKQLKRVTDVTQPSMLFHGHYHIYRDEMDVFRVTGEYEFYETRTICLDKELTNHNVGILNIDSLKFKIL